MEFGLPRTGMVLKMGNGLRELFMLGGRNTQPGANFFDRPSLCDGQCSAVDGKSMHRIEVFTFELVVKFHKDFFIRIEILFFI